MKNNDDTELRNALFKAHSRIGTLTAWIKQEADRNNTCAFNILGEICDNCKCVKSNYGKKSK